jgi:Pyridine nucleotide-disulphide oxidoreductase, dimerisation domain
MNTGLLVKLPSFQSFYLSRLHEHMARGTLAGLSEEAAVEQYGRDNIDTYLSRFASLEVSAAHLAVQRAIRSFCFHPKESLDETADEKAISTPCFAKLVVDKKSNERVLGFHYIGPNAVSLSSPLPSLLSLSSFFAGFSWFFRGLSWFCALCRARSRRVLPSAFAWAPRKKISTLWCVTFCQCCPAFSMLPRFFFPIFMCSISPMFIFWQVGIHPTAAEEFAVLSVTGSSAKAFYKKEGCGGGSCG